MDSGSHSFPQYRKDEHMPRLFKTGGAILLATLSLGMADQNRATAKQVVAPSSVSQSDLLPGCYNSGGGYLRIVQPFGVDGVSTGTCTPPPEWQIDGVTYDAI